MRYLTFLVALVGLLWPVISLAQGSMNPISQGLTPDEAIAAVRAEAKPGMAFRALRELSASVGTRGIGEQSLQEARARNMTLFRDGILADVLMSGGCLLAEDDPATGTTKALYLVAKRADGRTFSISRDVEGDISLSDTTELVRDTTDFVEVLLSTPSSSAASLEGRFVGGTFPAYDEKQGYVAFGIPSSLRKIKADAKDYREFAALQAAYGFWSYRYALSTVLYAANPIEAYSAAYDKSLALGREVLRINHVTEDDIAGPINDLYRFRKAIAWQRRIDEYLEDTLKKDAKPQSFGANKSVATIVTQLGTVRREGQTLFFALTASDIAVYWQRDATGALAVKMVSAGGN